MMRDKNCDMVKFSGDTSFIAAADIGGSHITVGFIAKGSPEVVDGMTVRIKLDSRGTQESILNSWFKAFESLSRKANRRVDRIAFAMPGPFDYEQGTCLIKGLDKYDNLYGLNVKNIFANHFKIKECEILFRNDAEAFLHGEVVAANLGMTNRILGVTLGTGFGSAISQNLYSKDLNLGLTSFKDSIVDDFLTTRWFRSAYERVGRPGMDVRQISILARQGETLAVKLFEEFADNLANVLFQVNSDLSPDDIIIGGNIAKAQDLFLPRVLSQLKTMHVHANLHLARLGEHSAMVGSAYLFNL